MMPNSESRDRFVCLYLVAFNVSFQYFVTDTLKMCRKKLNADKMNFDIYSILNFLVYFRQTHILNNGLKCILCEINFS